MIALPQPTLNIDKVMQMSDDHPTRDSMSTEEATISNMYEMAALVEVLERKRLCTQQDRCRRGKICQGGLKILRATSQAAPPTSLRW